MSVLQDRGNRRYQAVLGGITLLMLLAALGLAWAAGVAMQQVLVDHQARMASSLLAAEVPETVVATALSGKIPVTADGAALLDKLGAGSALIYDEALRSQALLVGGALLLLVVLISGAMVGMAWWFLRRRERRLFAACETVAAYANGDFSAHLPALEGGALAQFFGVVNELALSLKAEGDHAAQAKVFLSNMISDISHQVKTPLAALRMYNDIITSEPNHQEIVTRFAEKSARALDKLEQLIQSLLRLARLDVGNVPFASQPEHVQALVERALEPLAVRAQREGKTLMLRGAQETVLCCDATWMAEALGNLVKNALDHTSIGGEIVVHWESGPALVRLSVRDNGEGIAAEDIHHIFKRFYRSPHATSDTGGIGLGLPIAKAIVEGQGGSLTVASTPGEGTTFTMAFPRT